MKNFIYKKNIILTFVIIAAIMFTAPSVLAVWNGTFYRPGDTLSPECLPTDANCDVATGLSVAAGKTLTASNTLTLTATDGSTLAIGTGGTLGTNAYTSTAYSPLASPTFTGTVTIPTPFTLGAVSVTATGTQLNYLNAATGTTGTTSTNLVFSTSPTLITPALGTPSALVLTNATGLPAASVLAGTFGTGAYTMDTSLTTPLIIGGTATTSDLTLKTTSGVGATGADMHFLVGNNGATEAMTILNDGKVGIGTTSPAVNFAVAGQCVTGDTRLKRVKRKKKKIRRRQGSGGQENGEYEYEFEDIRIDEIKPGDKILTLDDKTGKLKISKVKKLMDMGVKQIFQIITVSGKKIRTTAEHPYFVKSSSPELPKTKPRLGIFFDNANMFYAQKKAGWKIDFTKLRKEFSAVFDIKFINFYSAVPTASDPAREATLNYFASIKKLVNLKTKPLKYIKTEKEINGKLVQIINKKGDMDVDLTLDVARSLSKLDIIMVISGDSDFLPLNDFVVKENNKKIVFAGFENNMAWELRQMKHLYLNRVKHLLSDRVVAVKKQAPSQGLGVVLLSLLYSRAPSLSSGGMWKKVKDLKVGREIAVINKNLKSNWDIIKEINILPSEQVYDIEVEGTHNFIGNDIVAHNTYINSTANTASIKGLEIDQSGAVTGTGYGLHVEKTGAGTTNVGGYFSATGATNNYGLIIENGSVGIGQTTPTAVLHLKAGTATASTAPLKFTSGTLLTTAEAGAVEFLTDAYYGTITTGAARRTFAFLESPTFTGTVTLPTPFTLGAVSVTATGTQLNYLNAATGTTGTTSTNLVFSTSPTLITPALGTPSALVLTNATGLPATAVLAGTFGTGAYTMDTSLTVPTIVGGTGTTSDLNLKTTSGIGAAGADMHFLVGNNGATEAMTILNSGNVGIGTAGPGTTGFGTGLNGQLHIASTNGGLMIEGTSQAQIEMIDSGATAGDRIFQIVNDGGNLTVRSLTDGGGVETTALTVQHTSGNVGIGTTSPGSILALGGTAARIFGMDRNTTAATAGQGFTISSGGAIAGTADLAGGDLSIKSGISTGTGTSALHFFTATAGVTGTADNAPTEKMTILGSGFVGIGITSPAGTLHVAGQCVTGDTKLRRRKKKKGATGASEEDYEYDEVRIDEIKSGDEILSLNEKTGELEYQKVKQLADMGVKPIFKLTTVSGKSIRTTGNHPYLVLPENKDTAMAFSHSRVFAFIDASNVYHATLREGWEVDYEKLYTYLTTRYGVSHVLFFSGTTHNKKRANLYDTLLRVGYELILVLTRLSASGEPKADVDSAMTFEMMRRIDEYDAAIVMTGDGDYYDLLKYLLSRKQFVRLVSTTKSSARDLRSLFGSNFVHLNSLRHLAEYADADNRNKDAETTNVSASRIVPIEYTKRSYLSNTPVNKQSILPFVKGGLWTKVTQIREGDMIAISGGDEAVYERITKIEKLPPEQVYDIEIENTHNFIGNDIVAHNTAIFGAGEGATPTTTTVRGAAGAGLNIAGANFTFDASNGTGTGGSGALIFRTAPVAASSSTVNTLAEIMRITPGGNVGIGTAGPTYLLHMKPTITGDGLLISETDSTANAALLFGYPTGGGLAVYTNGVQTISIDGTPTSVSYFNNGNVGIGTTSPGSILALGGTAARIFGMDRNTTAATAGQGFTISSGGAIAGTADLAGGDLSIKSGISTGTGTSALHFFTATAGVTGTADNTPTEKLTILGSGNVGIGASSPVEKLEVRSGNLYVTSPYPGTGATPVSYKMFFETLNNTPSRVAGAGMQVDYTRIADSDYRSDLSFYTSLDNVPAEKMRITNAGNIGIGTTAPTQKLTVVGAGTPVTPDSSAFVQVVGSTYGGIFIQAESGTFIHFGHSGDNNEGAIDYEDGIDSMYFTTGNSERMRIASGNVGIGTTDPSAQKLVVAGNVRVGTGTDGCVEDADGTLLAGTCSSDERLKKNIAPLSLVLDRLVQLNPVTYNWRADEFPERHLGDSLQTGLVAQEVEIQFPELVVTDDKGFKQIVFQYLPFYEIQAIKELNLKVNNLEATSLNVGAGTSITIDVFNAITAKFSDILGVIWENGVMKIANIITDKLTTKELCIEEVCVTKTQLKELLEKNNISGNSTSSVINNVGSNSGGSTPEPEITTSLSEEVTPPPQGGEETNANPPLLSEEGPASPDEAGGGDSSEGGGESEPALEPAPSETPAPESEP